MHTKKEEEKRFVISDSQAEPDTLTLSTLEFYIYIRICHGFQACSLILITGFISLHE